MCAPLPYFQPFSHFAQVIPTIVHLSRSEINSEMDDPAGSGALFAGRGKWVKVECSLFSFPFHFPCSYESWDKYIFSGKILGGTFSKQLYQMDERALLFRAAHNICHH